MIRRLLLSFFTLTLVAAAQDVHVRVSPDVVLPKDHPYGTNGASAFPTIQMALDHHPDAGATGRVFIEIAPGIYPERIIVTQNHPRITLLGRGKGPEEVVITNSLNAKQAGGTFFTETAEINGPAFQADNVTFENTAGNTGQAVAAAVRSDRAIFKRCRFLGHQDTLFADFGRQYYIDSYIEGGVDFIFGNAAAIFDHSEIHANGPGYLTAHSRTTDSQPTGYVLLHSRVTGADTSEKGFYLGRPWRPYSRVVVIETALPATLNPEGWSKWSGTDYDRTAYYAESANTGPGSGTTARAAWTHQLTPAQAKQYLPATFLAGSDHWNPEAEARTLP